jgi:hypothetical protein
MTLIQRLQQTILFPFLLPVFFVLHIARYFFGMVPLISALQMMGIYLLLSGGLYLLLRLILRRRAEAGLAAFLLVGLLLYWTTTIHFIARLLHTSAAVSHIPFWLLRTWQRMCLHAGCSVSCRRQRAHG